MVFKNILFGNAPLFDGRAKIATTNLRSWMVEFVLACCYSTLDVPNFVSRFLEDIDDD